MNFEFATTTRTIFGAGKLAELGDLAVGFGSRALLVTGARSTPTRTILSLLQRVGIQATPYAVASEPTIAMVEAGLALGRTTQSDFVIACGGGSVLDTGKAIAALLANAGAVRDYLEIVGSGRKLTRSSRPFIAIPTTSGTGTEVTRNAVLSVPEQRIKVSLRSALMLPTVALIDPELTYALPPKLTASSGMDALTQLIEPFVCRRANPLTDAICREGIPLAAKSLPQAFHDGTNSVARANLSLASWFGGLALANAGLGAVHGLAGPIGGMFPAPHGAICAALLPHVMAMNIRALERNDASRERYDEVARILTGNASASALAGVDWVAGLVRDLRIPGLSAYGISRRHTAELVAKAAQASSMKANPVALSAAELSAVLSAAL
ncbi:MAG: iron-containing alcohol dehydrogenase [Verrucomicrobiae bacterium]|nr:iron-containing alcohol dehydrogenase [Verrucomicrobiae bacterium]